MLMRCFGCGVQKDTDVKELYTPDDRLVRDRPIDPLFVIPCEGRGVHSGGAWRAVVTCHACFARLDVDHWISSDCWAKIAPRVSFSELPPHDAAGLDNPAWFAHVHVPEAA